MAQDAAGRWAGLLPEAGDRVPATSCTSRPCTTAWFLYHLPFVDAFASVVVFLLGNPSHTCFPYVLSEPRDGEPRTRDGDLFSIS